MKASVLLGLAAVAMAQRPADEPMCDYYTKALLKDNNAKNQGTVLTLLVNTVVLGKAMPKPEIEGVTFPDVDGLDGILSPNASYMGQPALLAPYFNGALVSSNRGGKPTAVNFLDDGGADPLMQSMPSNGNMESNQYMLLTHLYQFFGALLNCTQQGMGDEFKKYEGNANMYDVHKYMALNSSQFGFFVTQVGLAAKSFGVSDDDVTAVGMALNTAFGQRCSPEAEIIPDSGATPQAICITDDCAEADMPTCDAYDPAVQPAVADEENAMGLGNSSAMATGTEMGGSEETGTATGGMPSGTEGAGGMGGGSEGGSEGASSTAGAPSPTHFAGVLAAGGIAAAAFFL